MTPRHADFMTFVAQRVTKVMRSEAKVMRSEGVGA